MGWPTDGEIGWTGGRQLRGTTCVLAHWRFGLCDRLVEVEAVSLPIVTPSPAENFANLGVMKNGLNSRSKGR